MLHHKRNFNKTNCLTEQTSTNKLKPQKKTNEFRAHTNKKLTKNIARIHKPNISFLYSRWIRQTRTHTNIYTRTRNIEYIVEC